MSGKTRYIVEAKLRNLRRPPEQGAESVDHLVKDTALTLTVSAWLDHWLTNIARAHVRPRTLEGYIATVRRHVTPELGDVPLAALEPEHLEQLYVQLLSKGLSAATVLRVHRVMGRALRVAMQRGRVDRNVARLGGFGESSGRTLALPLPVVTALRSHKQRQEWQAATARGWATNDLVFSQRDGHPIDKKADYKDWCRLLEKAGVRHVRLHDGRHTTATLLLSDGVHPRVVMELLGHSQMLVVVDKIRWHRHADGTVSTDGGASRIFLDWTPEQSDLTATRYRYQLPTGRRRVVLLLQVKELRDGRKLLHLLD